MADPKVLKKWINEVPNDGMIRFRMLWQQDNIMLTSPKALAEVLVTKSYDFEKNAIARQFLSVLLGKGVLVVEGDEHKVSTFEGPSPILFSVYCSLCKADIS